MATKQEILNSIPPTQVSISRKEFARLLNLVTPDAEEILYPNVTVPKYLKKGDVYLSQVGSKRRPVVIIKVLSDIVLGIPLSTTKDELNLFKSSSRFFGTGWFSNQLFSSKIEYVFENWVGVYDNTKRLNQAIEQLKQTYNTYL